MRKNNTNIKYKIKNLITLSLLFLFFFGCAEDPTSNPYEEGKFKNGDELGQPVITSIEPAEEALAGITVIKIIGKNFLSSSEREFVYFGGKKAEIISTSPTEIIVKAPNYVKDSLKVQIQTKHPLHSEYIFYNLKAGAYQPYPFTVNEVPYSVAIDENEQIYVSMTEYNIGVGIKVFSDGTLPKEWVPRGEGKETSWSALRFGKNGNMYATRKNRAVYQFPSGATPGRIPWAKGFKDNLVDIDFDANGYLWACGGNSIYRIDDKAQNKQFEAGKNITNLRIFQNSIYFISKNIIYKVAINKSYEIGQPEKYFDFAKKFPLNNVKCIDFASDGTMYLGTDIIDPILIVKTDKSFESLYTTVLSQIPITNNSSNEITNLAWGKGKFLYAVYKGMIKEGEETKTSTTLLKINMQEKVGAPTYGRD